MCSEQEALDRQACMEVSRFEATAGTFDLALKLREADPLLCVKKYRRSAAGGGVRTFESEVPRDGPALAASVDRLLNGIVGGVLGSFERSRSLAAAAGFVADRCRAISVDIVTNRMEPQVAAPVMTRIARYYILASYIFCEIKSPKFEHRFNVSALQSSLSMLRSFTVGSSLWRDEFLSYTALLHIAGVVSSTPGLGLDAGAGMTPLCAVVPDDFMGGPAHGQGEEGRAYPKLAFALRLAEAWEAGNYRLFLRTMKELPGPLSPWAFLMRCAMARAAVEVRLCLLKQMNKALLKGAKMKLAEVGRLLFCSVDQAKAIAKEAGLPIEVDCVVFKTVSIEESELEVKRDDNFVLGEALKDRIVREVDEDGVTLFSAEFVKYILQN